MIPILPSAASTRSRVSANTAFPKATRRASPIWFTFHAWLKCHFPAAFACALLNSQPMGFYAPAQIVRDAQRAWRHGAAGGCELLRVGLHAGGRGGGYRPAAWPAADRRLSRTRRRQAGGGARCGRNLRRSGFAEGARGALARHDRAAGQCRCLFLDGPAAPAGAVGGAQPDRRARPAAVRCRAGTRRRGRAPRRPASGHAAERGSRRRLPDAAACRSKPIRWRSCAPALASVASCAPQT